MHNQQQQTVTVTVTVRVAVAFLLLVTSVLTTTTQASSVPTAATTSISPVEVGIRSALAAFSTRTRAPTQQQQQHPQQHQHHQQQQQPRAHHWFNNCFNNNALTSSHAPPPLAAATSTSCSSTSSLKHAQEYHVAASSSSSRAAFAKEKELMEEEVEMEENEDGEGLHQQTTSTYAFLNRQQTEQRKKAQKTQKNPLQQERHNIIGATTTSSPTSSRNSLSSHNDNNSDNDNDIDNDFDCSYNNFDYNYDDNLDTWNDDKELESMGYLSGGGGPSVVSTLSSASASSSSSSSSSSSITSSTKEQKAVVIVPPSENPTTTTTSSTSTTRGGGGRSSAAHHHHRRLAFWENMIAGAISRSVAQTIMHPANTLKTMLQTSRQPHDLKMMELLQPRHFRRLTRGAGANFLLSVPHGAVNFAVLELVRRKLSTFVETTPALYTRADKIGPTLDFVSSAISTITCSIVSTPQMVVADNIMAGNYQNLLDCCRGLASSRGISGFYQGWWPGLVGKIPSYALTWTFFQQLKEARDKFTGRPATDIENTIMGCIASGTTVCIMIPLDTIKTRLVTQSAARAAAAGQVAYKGIVDCAVRVVREEGVQALYRGLAPRLISVMPMIGIQFGVYEFMKKTMLEQQQQRRRQRQQQQLLQPPVKLLTGKASTTTIPTQKGKTKLAAKQTEQEEDVEGEEADPYGTSEVLQEAAMEVAADPEVPFPAPHFNKLFKKEQEDDSNNKSKKSKLKRLLLKRARK